MDSVEGGTGSCSATCVTCDGDGTEEVGVKVGEAIDTGGEIAVRLWGVL
jgi:hypothetical protein